MKMIVSAWTSANCGAAIRALVPSMELVTPNEGGGWSSDIEDVAAIYYAHPGVLSVDHKNLDRFITLPRLRWLQTSTAGLDDPRYRELVRRGVAVTSSPGAAPPGVAQHVLAMMLYHARKLPLFVEQQRQHVWRGTLAEELTGRVVGIVGAGRVGQEVARVCKAMGMTTMGVRRRAQPTPHVDEPLGLEGLGSLLQRSDYVVICMELTADTRHLLSASALSAMKPTAWLINVSRGAIVDEAALIAALQERRIAGACLDVASVEPLPGDSPLWTLPNVLLTPHIANVSPQFLRRAADIFLENLRRFASGEELLYRLGS